MSKQEDANLILKLYDLRREPVMREARNWFFTFNPTSAADYMETMFGDHSGHARMVISYWDMAASLVNNGAIDFETLIRRAPNSAERLAAIRERIKMIQTMMAERAAKAQAATA